MHLGNRKENFSQSTGIAFPALRQEPHNLNKRAIANYELKLLNSIYSKKNI
jgi:hypothetical protein